MGDQRSAPDGSQMLIWTFLAFTAGFSALFYARILGGGMTNTLALMWSPGVAALLTRLLYQRNVKGEGWGWGETRWQVLAYLLPMAYATVAYGAVWLLGLG